MATPHATLASADAADAYRRAFPDEAMARRVRRLARLTGIAQRPLVVLEEQDPERFLYQPADAQPGGPGMGARNALFLPAANRLIDALVEQLPAESLADVGHLVTVTCTHAGSPGLEQAWVQPGRVRRDVQRWNLGFMGCSAGLAGLRLVHHLPPGCGDALVCACELSSLHFQYDETLDQLTANLLFADGAAATRLSPAPGRARLVSAACASLPEAADQMVWWADDRGLRLRLSPQLPATLAAHLPDALGAFLDQADVRRRDVAHWAVHPGGPQILDAVRDAFALDEAALATSRGVLREFGNLSSPTILFILDRILRSAARGPCIAVAFGPGLTIEMALFDLAG